MISIEMENIIEEVEHSLAVEHMTMTDDERENLRKVGRGELTYRDLVNHICCGRKAIGGIPCLDELTITNTTAMTLMFMRERRCCATS